MIRIPRFLGSVTSRDPSRIPVSQKHGDPATGDDRAGCLDYARSMVHMTPDKTNMVGS